MKSLSVKAHRVREFLCAVILLLPAVVWSAEGPVLEIVHFWKSESERKALNVIADRYRALGGEWIERKYPRRESLREQVLVRLRDGFPPMAIQWNPVLEPLNDIHNAGLLTALESLASNKLLNVISPQVRELVSVDGDTVALPVSMHSVNSAYYNRSILKRFGFEVPTDWATFFTQMKTLQEAKVPTIAMGSERWEHWIVLSDMLLANGGQELFFATRYTGVVPLALVDELEATFQDFIDFQKILKNSGVIADNWNEASLAVARGNAAVHISGDWVKAEMIAAGYSLNKDFLCAMAPGTDRLVQPIIVSFVLPRSEYEQDIEAQKRLVRIALNAETQRHFAQLKGSMPVVINNDDSYIDNCNRQHRKIIQDGGLVSFISPDQPNPALDKAVLEVLGQITDGTIDDASFAAYRLMGLFEIARGL